MKPLNIRRRLHFVVAVGNEYVSTPKAYGALDSLYHDFDASVAYGNADALSELCDYLCARRDDIGELFNIFEDAVLPICSQASRIRQKMKELSASAALMSGSGPSVFGIFDSAQAASAAKDALISEGYRAFVATSV